MSEISKQEAAEYASIDEPQEQGASEFKALLSAMGVTDEWRIENIKESAMNRCNVKKSRRAHVRRVLDCAFEQLKAHDR